MGIFHVKNISEWRIVCRCGSEVNLIPFGSGGFDVMLEGECHGWTDVEGNDLDWAGENEEIFHCLTCNSSIRFFI
jgi:hypothetical protein